MQQPNANSAGYAPLRVKNKPNGGEELEGLGDEEME